MIRRRVVAGALALFVATWLLITVILVTGHDPALARQTKSASTQTTTTGSSGSGNTTSSGSGDTSSSSTAGSSGTSSSSGGGSGLSAVTSSQS